MDVECAVTVGIARPQWDWRGTLSNGTGVFVSRCTIGLSRSRVTTLYSSGRRNCKKAAGCARMLQVGCG